MWQISYPLRMVRVRVIISWQKFQKWLFLRQKRVNKNCGGTQTCKLFFKWFPFLNLYWMKLKTLEKWHRYISFTFHYQNAITFLITRIIGIQDCFTCLHITLLIVEWCCKFWPAIECLALYVSTSYRVLIIHTYLITIFLPLPKKVLCLGVYCTLFGYFVCTQNNVYVYV